MRCSEDEANVTSAVYEDSSPSSQQIAPYFENLSINLSRQKIVTFVTIDHDDHKDISQEYGVSTTPAFVIFRDAKVIQKVEGLAPREIQAVLNKVVMELENVESGGSGSGSGSAWKADVPRGYSDITDQVEIRNCELLNADEDAGPVKVLFEDSKPSALDDKGKGSSKDWVQSGSDDQLLLYIPFQASIKVHTLQVRATDAPALGMLTLSRSSLRYRRQTRTTPHRDPRSFTCTSTGPRASISTKPTTRSLHRPSL